MCDMYHEMWHLLYKPNSDTAMTSCPMSLYSPAHWLVDRTCIPAASINMHTDWLKCQQPLTHTHIMYPSSLHSPTKWSSDSKGTFWWSLSWRSLILSILRFTLLSASSSWLCLISTILMRFVLINSAPLDRGHGEMGQEGHSCLVKPAITATWEVF